MQTTVPFIAPSKRLGQVEEYYFSRKLRQIAEMRAAGHPVLNLGIGSPDLPPHPTVIARLNESADSPNNHAYQSYQGLPELRKAFAEWYAKYFGVNLNPANEILPLIGSKEGIMHISMAFLDEDDEVLAPNPGYPTYRSATELAGARVREYELLESNNWLPDLEQLAKQDLSKVKLMWVNYPHMPTGATADAAFFEQLVAFAHTHQILLINDNPYAFILNEQPISLLSVPGAMEVALELNSLSKAHNMAGWRVGMLAGRPDFIEPVLRFKSNMDSGMFKPVQLAAIEALRLPKSWYDDLNQTYRSRRVVATKLLQSLGCTVDDSQVGLFVWGQVDSRYGDAYALADQLLEDAHVFITPGGIFGSAGKAYLRISLCSPVEQLEEAMTRLAQLNTITTPLIA